MIVLSEPRMIERLDVDSTTPLRAALQTSLDQARAALARPVWQLRGAAAATCGDLAAHLEALRGEVRLVLFRLLAVRQR